MVVETQPKQTQPTSVPSGDKTLAILALIFAIVFPIVGLILAIIAKKKYPKGTDGYGLVKAAKIISIILIVVPILIGILAFFGLFMATQTI